MRGNHNTYNVWSSCEVLHNLVASNSWLDIRLKFFLGNRMEVTKRNGMPQFCFQKTQDFHKKSQTYKIQTKFLANEFKNVSMDMDIRPSTRMLRHWKVKNTIECSIFQLFNEINVGHFKAIETESAQKKQNIFCYCCYKTSGRLPLLVSRCNNATFCKNRIFFSLSFFFCFMISFHHLKNLVGFFSEWKPIILTSVSISYFF